MPDRESAEYWNKRLAREGLRTIKGRQTFERDWIKRKKPRSPILGAVTVYK